jgi:2-phospho-L-lactate guanylyltransferase
MSSEPRPDRRCTVVVPVKPPARGKSRLAGLPEAVRRELAAAFALDTVAAALATPGVGRVLAVTDDFRFAHELGQAGCEVLPDGVGGDLNATLVQAAAEAERRWPGGPVVALCADLPALRSHDLAAALGAWDRARPAFVADVAGTGTTLYLAPAGRFAPCFGPASRDAHLTAGADELIGPWASLRQDVDDLGDLGRAVALGVGEHTARAAGGPE